MSPHNSPSHQLVKPSVTLSGTINKCSNGPAIGLVDLGTSGNSYFARIALPGIRRNNSKLHCEVQRNGTVHIKGVVTPEVVILSNSSKEFKMIQQQLCPAGPFSVTFKLPGPVDGRLVYPNFRMDGILEVFFTRYNPQV